jgi:hypothetical protein
VLKASLTAQKKTFPEETREINLEEKMLSFHGRGKGWSSFLFGSGLLFPF